MGWGLVLFPTPGPSVWQVAGEQSRSRLDFPGDSAAGQARSGTKCLLDKGDQLAAFRGDHAPAGSLGRCGGWEEEGGVAGQAGVKVRALDQRRGANVRRTEPQFPKCGNWADGAALRRRLVRPAWPRARAPSPGSRPRPPRRPGRLFPPRAEAGWTPPRPAAPEEPGATSHLPVRVRGHPAATRWRRRRACHANGAGRPQKSPQTV